MRRGEARVIPVILRPCDWHSAPFGKLQALPKDGKAVTTWANRDEAFTDIARGIRRVAEALRPPLDGPPPGQEPDPAGATPQPAARVEHPPAAQPPLHRARGHPRRPGKRRSPPAAPPR